MPKEKMVIPLDGSKMGEAALAYVREMLSRLNLVDRVEVVLVQVVSSLPHPVAAGGEIMEVPYTEVELEQIRKKAAEYLEQVAGTLRSVGVEVSCVVRVGRAAEEIIALSDEISAGLVAMSTHGRSGLSQWAFGSVTGRVLRGGHIPVLLVRAGKETFKE